MLLQIFGLPDSPTWWHLNRIPSDGGGGLALHLRQVVPGAKNLRFYIQKLPLDDMTVQQLSQLWSNGVGYLIAKPAQAAAISEPESRLLLVTDEGRDAGRIFPLTRANLAVGRSGSQAQIRDPWLSAHDFNIRMSSNGTVVTPIHDIPVHWESDETFVAGRTRFKLHRGAGDRLRVPHYPGAFEVSCGQPPSPPNIVLQVIGAAAPLLIGIVLMVVTGMWYFLLFSGISVIIAFVLITQYRKSRRRFIEKISAALASTVENIHNSIFTPSQLMLALTAHVADPLALTKKQPENPVIHVGSGICKAQMLHVQNTQQWDAYLDARTDLVLELLPGQRTVIIGESDLLQPLKNWIIAQLLRHVRATATGLVIDGHQVGGSPRVEISDGLTPSDNASVHHLIFTKDVYFADSSTIVLDLNSHRITGSWTATDVVPIGISSILLDRITHELGLHQPAHQPSSNHLVLSSPCMRGQAISQLATSLGTGTLGLTFDLVSDGPHVLITGTTGSGKSELLLTLLAGFAERYPPCEISMILLDFKGGSSFNVLAMLPHVMSVETNHIAATSLRSLKAIAAELFRRERLFSDYQVADYDDFRRRAPHIVLPRLVVAIDELRVLVEQNPEASTTLAHLAATGRSLGFHLIIATQRTQGAVSADIRANIGSSICLRTATEHDSWDVLGTAEAFSISPTTPGRAYYKGGASKPQLFQTCRYLLDDEPVVLQPIDTSQRSFDQTTTDWSALVQTLRERASDLPLPDPIILPALPQHISKSALQPVDSSMEATAIGLVDDPMQSRQFPVYLGQAPSGSEEFVLSRSVAWIGAADSGITQSLYETSRYVLGTAVHRIFLDGQPHVQTSKGWDTYLHHSAANADVLKQFLADTATVLATSAEVIIVIADWGSWADALVTGSFQGFEEQLIQIMRQYSTNLKVYVFGGRELAGGRLLGMIPDRFYLPKNSSIEHRMIWPKLVDTPTVTSRAVLVTADEPNGGWEVQLVNGS